MRTLSFILAVVVIPLASAATGTVRVEWDVVSWTTDGYQAQVVLNATHAGRFPTHGWAYGWTWTKKEVIWEVEGARVEDQGNCSRFRGNKPLSCDRSLTLLPEWKESRTTSRTAVLVSFTVTVGDAGLTVDTVTFPTNFTLREPSATCGPVTKSAPHQAGALVSWEATCGF